MHFRFCVLETFLIPDGINLAQQNCQKMFLPPQMRVSTLDERHPAPYDVSATSAIRAGRRFALA